MELEEKKVYHELPGGKNKFHSAILSTYSFNFHHFEYQTLKTLKQKWVINVGVLVDSNKLDEVLGVSSGGLKQLTKSYSINGIRTKGAFHPKISFFIGDKHLLLILGSGNLTPGGQGKNHETFSALYANEKDSNLIPILNEAYDYLKQVSTDLDGFSSRRILKSIPANCDFLNISIKRKHDFYRVNNKLELSLLYNESTSIFKQIIKAIPSSDIKKIRILSPYFDKNGKLITNFLKAFSNSRIEVYLPEHNGLPPIEFTENKRVKFFKWEDTKRGGKKITSPEAFDRKLHSKLFLFESEKNSYLVLGSANATIAAFGTEDARGVNDEFNLLYKSVKRDFFKELGIYGTKTKVNPNQLKRDSVTLESSPEKEQKVLRKAEITSCDLDKVTLAITSKLKVNPLRCNLCLFDDLGNCIKRLEQILKSRSKIILSSELIKEKLAFIQLEDENGNHLSNKQVINSIDKLYETDPSIENRTIRGIRNALEIGKINEYELMGYLNIVRPNEKEREFNSSSGSILKPAQDTSSNMTYAQAMEASKNKSLESKITSQHSSVQFWQSINTVLKQRFEGVQNALADEEEDADATTSKDRQTDSDEVKRVIEVRDTKESNRILNRTLSLAENYKKALQVATRDTVLEINEITFCQFLLVGHVLSAIHHFNDYDLPKDKKGNYTTYTPEKWNIISDGRYSMLMNEIINEFAKMCLSHQFIETREDSFRQNQLNEYKKDVLANLLLYHFLINKNSDRNPMIDSTDLSCLTIFKILGFPEEKTIERLELISKSESVELFNIERVKKLQKRLKTIQLNIDNKNGYFQHPTKGVCQIYGKKKSILKYMSIYDFGKFSTLKYSEFKKI